MHFTQWQKCDSSGVQTLHNIKYRAAWLEEATAVRELKILTAWGECCQSRKPNIDISSALRARAGLRDSLRAGRGGSAHHLLAPLPAPLAGFL